MSKKMFFRQHLGNMEQLAGLRSVTVNSGRGRDVRLVEVDNGSGLNFTVMADRCCDIYSAKFKGQSLAWLAPNGVVNPNAYEPENVMWLRSWPGGLLTTAGLLNVGGPEDGHSLHGRVAHIAAEDLTLERSWVDDEYVLSVAGVMRHTMVFGEKLELRRRITTAYGSNIIKIADTVENQGFAPVPLMMLYHCNFGYPAIGENAVLQAVEHKITPKDEHSAADIDAWNKMDAPIHGYAEELFYHEIPADSDGLARMSIVNPESGLKVTMAYNPATLPVLNQWKQMGEGEYVTGLEPGNCYPIGQKGNAQNGMLRMIEPGETVKFALQIEISEL
ncbi:MAG: DUF4432 family protein [Lentisphaerae bacterium]|nr:DUF4432 family protein [Lentisphaerota bacterium]